VLERAEDLGSSWRRHYDRLHLHTPRELSGLPGFPIPKEMGRWVGRDDVVRYLELYAAHHRLEIRTGADVATIEPTPDGDGWTAVLSSGERLSAPYVVVATGYSHTPRRPDLLGLERFPGEVVSSRDYRSGAQFADRDVLVVGTGNTGTEIAVDLAEHGASRVRLAVRTVPHIQRRDFGPWAAQYGGILIRRLPLPVGDLAARAVARLTTPDLTAHGLPRPDTGLLTRVVTDKAIPVQDVGIIAAIQSGAVEPVASVSAFDDDGVRLADGSHVAPDTVVLAAGYVHGLESLVGHLGVLDEAGRPVVTGGRTPRGARGLWFIGYTNPISGMLREIRIDARKIALAMALAKRERQRSAS
jgi:cation diffusion facilitator CzcD-associated flavoprotein CzcO